jgi:predicted nucleotidyltransferase
MIATRLTVDREELAELCRHNGVVKLSVFGSALRDDFDPERSDLDLLVEFGPRVSRSLFKLVQLQNALTELFGRQVDLTTPGSISKYFRDDVLSTAQVVYVAA